ncbi:MAG: hypothetical protein AAF899_03675 [Pseudomonadota bacterium]
MADGETVARNLSVMREVGFDPGRLSGQSTSCVTILAPVAGDLTANRIKIGFPRLKIRD